MYKLLFSIVLICSAIVLANAQQGTGQGNGMGSGMGSGTGRGAGNGSGSDSEIVKKGGKVAALRITSKPQARYTEIARQNLIQGKVLLKIEFKKNGKIGKISVVSGLQDGLNEEAIKAAEQIRFEPARRNGKPYTVTKTITYNYTIY